jgi:hypothetical protein
MPRRSSYRRPECGCWVDRRTKRWRFALEHRPGAALGHSRNPEIGDKGGARRRHRLRGLYADEGGRLTVVTRRPRHSDTRKGRNIRHEILGAQQTAHCRPGSLAQRLGIAIDRRASGLGHSKRNDRRRQGVRFRSRETDE